MAVSDGVTDLITLLSGAFPERKIDDKLIKAYVSGLDDLNASSLEAAGKELIRTAKFFPRVAEIRAVAEKATRQVSGYDNLMADYQQIVDSLAHDPAAYRAIAEKFERAGRQCMADSIRARADRCEEAMAVVVEELVEA